MDVVHYIRRYEDANGRVAAMQRYRSTLGEYATPVSSMATGGRLYVFNAISDKAAAMVRRGELPYYDPNPFVLCINERPTVDHILGVNLNVLPIRHKYELILKIVAAFGKWNQSGDGYDFPPQMPISHRNVKYFTGLKGTLAINKYEVRKIDGIRQIEWNSFPAPLYLNTGNVVYSKKQLH